MADAPQAAAAGARGLPKRDLSLAARIVGEGRALLILLNKADLLPEPERAKVAAGPPSRYLSAKNSV